MAIGSNATVSQSSGRQRDEIPYCRLVNFDGINDALCVAGLTSTPDDAPYAFNWYGAILSFQDFKNVARSPYDFRLQTFGHGQIELSGTDADVIHVTSSLYFVTTSSAQPKPLRRPSKALNDATEPSQSMPRIFLPGRPQRGRALARAKVAKGAAKPLQAQLHTSARPETRLLIAVGHGPIASGPTRSGMIGIPPR
ncbi:unnamed protein product [Symbiodinium necroappetens]|uniref:Uncharacterized protein n=1 Tax=Symbiodinium necroappetens TaxID=1628268 RepID=A0A812IZD2_9DINO|nr:unnamed protein product [Symbiodinium necroappetens]